MKCLLVIKITQCHIFGVHLESYITNRKTGLEQAVLDNGWDAYFDSAYRPDNTRVAMYNVPRFAYSAALLYKGYNPNEVSEELLDIAEETLLQTDFIEWGFDTLKKALLPIT